MSEKREQFVDAMVSAVLHADESELAEDVATGGEGLTDDIENLRARFLERVTTARDSVIERKSSADDHGQSSSLPLKIGRYPILRRIGSGGMGVVYEAYDETLDRRLAIKVLHDRVWDVDGRRRERLLREGQAMARVAHPNLVTVYEVVGGETQMFVAMEFVSGPTLKQWLMADRRSWRQIVAVFIQIAEGLAALHDAGLVHRDVKPANVIIGENGRVRVLDLGLVGARQQDAMHMHTEGFESSSSSLNNRLEEPLTMTGERLGTPAYMSREQFLMLDLTPASDIFAFSVVLFEALFGVHPFAAKTLRELQAKVVDNRYSIPSPSTVPTWLTNLVIRGFSPDPKDRPPSMRAYATALARDPSRTRRRTFATVGVAVLAACAGVGITMLRTNAPAKSCDGAEEAISEVWNETRAAEIKRAMLAAGGRYAVTAERVPEQLQDYADGWVVAHSRICEEYARGDHSAGMLDERMACLHRRRQALAETVSLLAEADAELTERAGEMVAKLPRLEACDDLGALSWRSTWAPLGISPVIESLEEKLVSVEVLANAGFIDDAVESARTVAKEAEAIDQKPMVVEALLAEVRASMMLVPDGETYMALDQALEIAITEGLDPLAAEAMIRRVYLRALKLGGSDAALADLPIAKAMWTRGGSDPELGALFENNAGTVYLATGDLEGARQAFERSLEIKKLLFKNDHHLELAPSLAGLAIVTSDEQARRKLDQQIITIYEQSLGPDHPRTLDARFLAARAIDDPELAEAELSEICPRFLKIDRRLAGECELEHGRLEFARGQFETGHHLLTLARAHLATDDERRVVVEAYLALGTDAADDTIRKLREQIAAEQLGGDDWWVVTGQAERRLLLVWLLEDDPTAIDTLEHVIADLEKIANKTPASEKRERLLALARSTLAFRLAARGDYKRAFGLASVAKLFYQQWTPAYAVRLDELDALLSHPSQ